MSEIISATGSCLCGSVKLETQSMNTSLGVCHCNMCRKWSTGPLMTVSCGDDLKISGQEFITTFNSSDWAERAFCKKCGSNLYYHLKESNQFIVSAGVFGDQNLHFDHQVFIDEKPEYYEFSNKTKNMTGAELFAAFSSET